MGVVEMQLRSFLTSALNVGESHVPAALFPFTHEIEGWVGSIAVLDAL